MPNENKINSNHRRVLSSTAILVDKELLEIESIILENNNDSRMITIEKSYDDYKRKELLVLINSLREMNNKMFARLELDGKKISERQLIYSKISFLWTILSDSNSQKLKSYGKLFETAGTEIDNHLTKMLTWIEKILKL